MKALLFPYHPEPGNRNALVVKPLNEPLYPKRP